MTISSAGPGKSARTSRRESAFDPDRIVWLTEARGRGRFAGMDNATSSFTRTAYFRNGSDALSTITLGSDVQAYYRGTGIEFVDNRNAKVQVNELEVITNSDNHILVVNDDGATLTAANSMAAGYTAGYIKGDTYVHVTAVKEGTKTTFTFKTSPNESDRESTYDLIWGGVATFKLKVTIRRKAVI